jgi:hypothetical protein
VLRANFILFHDSQMTVIELLDRTSSSLGPASASLNKKPHHFPNVSRTFHLTWMRPSDVVDKAAGISETGIRSFRDLEPTYGSNESAVPTSASTVSAVRAWLSKPKK